MADHAKIAASVLKGVGGEDNVKELSHCATRLRFILNDEKKADAAAVKAIPGVITTAEAGGQFQVIIGNEVPEVFAEIGKISKLTTTTKSVDSAAPKGNLFNRFVALISGVFSPVLWALAGTGLLKAFVAMAVTFGWLSDQTSTWQVLNGLSDGFFYFLPVALAVTAAKYFDAQQFTSIAIAGALVHPGIAAMSGQEGLTFFGIPLTMISYGSSVIPVIVAVWLQSHMERFLYAKLHSTIRRFATPMIVVFVLVPLIFLVIGPVSQYVSGALAGGVGWLFETVPWLGGAIMGGLWQVFVMFGMHWGFVPLMLLELENTGYVVLYAPLFASALGQAAAIAGVLVRTRNKRLKTLAAPATLSGFLAGVTEPGIYGVTLPLKRPFIYGLIGGALGGAIISLGGVAGNAIPLPSLLSLPALFSRGSITMLIIGITVAIVVSFLLTVLLGFKDPVDEEAPVAEATAPTEAGTVADIQILSPLQGTAIALAEVADPVFAGGALGVGAAVRPSSGTVVAPFDGEVVAVFPTWHAIGLRSTTGAELLIHVGMNTVKLGGTHFTTRVAQGQHVNAGDVLVEFDKDAILAEGYDLTTPVVITNHRKFETLAEVASGAIGIGDPLYLAVAAQKANA
ncbi:MAG TPA: beta-glucoside-specific PTS transporter subunit IIABC [Arachnia sp.]|nr:beta-glucoside-specific PTS transporter subunit IIABC [Arachnia sp.]HMT85401.1 beta-glucoside-specific PTS transporter subunit IIABC [Arachnia sp.]